MDTEILQSLLEPISEESPSGVSLRYEGTYDRIQEARREDADLPQGVWQKDVKRADWPLVESLCTDALSEKTKDLQIAVWLAEAWMQMRGVAGLRDGAEMLHAMCTTFWDTMYPELEPDDAEYRLAPLIWMNEKLWVPLKQVHITHPSGDAQPYSWFDLEKAQQLENLVRRDPSVIDEIEPDQVTVTLFEQSVALTPPEYFATLKQDAAACVEALNAIESFVDERHGGDALSLRQFREVVNSIQNFAATTLATIGYDGAAGVPGNAAMAFDAGADGSNPSPETLPLQNTGIAVTDGAGSAPGGMVIRSRADAYRVLALVADYLIQLEPHSPAPYLVKRAIRWGNMPLAQVLQELLEHGADIYSICRLLGIDPETLGGE